MNFAALIQAALSLLEEKPHGKGKGRNAARLSQLTGLGVCITLLITLNSKMEKHGEKLGSVDNRLVRVETRLGIGGAPASGPASDAPNVTHQAVTIPGPVTPAVSRHLPVEAENDPRTNRFVFLHKGE